ncbi:MAG: low-specificity L-threonine aldolase [Chloroflexi bacterium]|nr:low-specificity L-threonine aldolase [Chloroflexota bacterium]
MKIYDFRSDTVTHPTPEMRAAMAAAPVGDDVYGEDPTVNQMEALAAKMMGKEAGLLVTSGTQGNLTAVLAACDRGDEVVMGKQGHTFLHEAGGVSVLGGVVIHTIPNQGDGSLALEDIRGAMRFPGDPHEPISKMVIVENTQNACGGKALSMGYMNSVGSLADELGLFYHVDGARIFNAAVAQKVSTSGLLESADSVTFCLSKGLCAPVGSVLCGSEEFIHRARRIRKLLGGGMRQAGVIAAAGIVALEKMVERLAADHQRATVLAEGLADIPGVVLTKGSPNTNMVFFRLDQALGVSHLELIQAMEERNVLINDTNDGEIRLVTHYDVGDEAIEACLQSVRAILT